MSLDSAPKSNGLAVGKSIDSDMEMKVCVDASFTNATYEVNPHSRNVHLSIYQDHPKSCVNNFYEESKQEEWLRPVRKEQSLEKIVELRKDPCAVSSTFLQSPNPREETRDNSEASAISLRQELNEASKEHQEIEMQGIKRDPEADKDEYITISTVHEQGSNQEASEEPKD